MLNIEQINIDDFDRVFVIGDVHGCVSHVQFLAKELNVGKNDLILGVGDVIDRKPTSFETLEYFTETPYVKSALGNHEWFAIRAMLYHDRSAFHSWYMHGGEWIDEHDDNDIAELLIKAEAQMPITFQINIGKKRIAITHAGIPDNDFKNLRKPSQKQCSEAMLPENFELEEREPVKNTDLCIHGHFTLDQPSLFGNQLYIDTGCWMDIGQEDTRYLTVVEITKERASVFGIKQTPSTRTPFMVMDEVTSITQSINQILY
ncbi:metallophosphoesterase [Vibrio breoganii]